MPSGTLTRLAGAFALAADDVWAVGDGGVVLRWRGTSWDPVASGVTVDLRAVWAASTDDATVVGDDGTILRWNGSGFAPEISGTGDQLHGVWCTGPDDVWPFGGAEFDSRARRSARGRRRRENVETGSILALRAVAGFGPAAGGAWAGRSSARTCD